VFDRHSTDSLVLNNEFDVLTNSEIRITLFCHRFDCCATILALLTRIVFVPLVVNSLLDAICQIWNRTKTEAGPVRCQSSARDANSRWPERHRGSEYEYLDSSVDTYKLLQPGWKR